MSDWIDRVADDVNIARCKCCHTFLPAHYAGLCNHARSVQHLQNKATESSTINILENESEQHCNLDGAIRMLKSDIDSKNVAFDEPSTSAEVPVNMVCSVQLNIYLLL